MGLGGRRERQVIAADPRNTRWINDTSSPGHRLLTSMGYDPSNGQAGDNKTGLYAHNSTKRLRAIPVAKAGMEGIGFKPNGPGANVALGALPSRGASGPGSMASAASNIFAKLGSRAALQFVTAGASKEVINRSRTEGGEFGGLLARLNAASSASATPEVTDDEAESLTRQPVASGSKQTKLEGEVEDGAALASSDAGSDTSERQRKRQRKLEKAAKKERKLAKKLAKASASATASADQSAGSGTDTSPACVTVTATASFAEIQPPQENVRRIAHWNASRSRNLASKRMLHASADALAEILGVAPTPSPSASGYSTPASLPPTIAPSPSLSKRHSPAPEAASSGNESTGKADKKAEKLARKIAQKAKRGTDTSETVSPDSHGTEATAAETLNSKKDKKKRKRSE